MLEDADNKSRSKAFREALAGAQVCTLDDYIDFLSENMCSEYCKPVKKITTNFKL